MPTSHISTPIGALPAPTVIAALHNHDLMIRTICPALASYYFESGSPYGQATYCITDRTPSGQTSYRITLSNTPTGVDSLIIAAPPVGVLTISGKWRVAGAALTEEVEIDANFMMKKVAKSNVDRTHPQQHLQLLERAMG